MPTAATGETLPERARRILGVDLDTWLAREIGHGDSSHSRNRGEQIAYAQRKHRQRTQSYIQALELEVLRLRKIERSLKADVAELRERLESKQVSNHDHPHCQEEHTAIPPTPSLSTSSQSPITAENSVMIDWAGVLDITPEAPCCIQAAENTPPAMEWLAPSHTHGMDSMQLQEPLSRPGTNFVEEVSPSKWEEGDPKHGLGFDTEAKDSALDPLKGLDLILKLERPCLGHLKHATVVQSGPEGFVEAPYNFGTNHCYNLSTRLFHISQSESPYQSSATEGVAVTKKDLQSLLAASECLQLANELTPVQVWDIVIKLDSIKSIDFSIITAMFDELSKYTYCNSFGAAISRVTVKAALEYFLGWTHT